MEKIPISKELFGIQIVYTHYGLFGILEGFWENAGQFGPQVRLIGQQIESGQEKYFIN